MTKDNKLVIIHGGENGEMPGENEKLIFEMTYEELQQKFKTTEYFLNSS